jgi:WD40 repeat protein
VKPTQAADELGRSVARGRPSGSAHSRTVSSSDPLASSAPSGLNATVRTLAFYADGALLATGGDDKVIRLWDVQSGQCVGILSHWDDVDTLTISPDGQLLVSLTQYHPTMYIWDLSSTLSICSTNSVG